MVTNEEERVEAALTKFSIGKSLEHSSADRPGLRRIQPNPRPGGPSSKKNPPAFEREEDVAFYPGLKMKKI
jgi:hypothetical protein